MGNFLCCKKKCFTENINLQKKDNKEEYDTEKHYLLLINSLDKCLNTTVIKKIKNEEDITCKNSGKIKKALDFLENTEEQKTQYYENVKTWYEEYKDKRDEKIYKGIQSAVHVKTEDPIKNENYVAIKYDKSYFDSTEVEALFEDHSSSGIVYNGDTQTRFETSIAMNYFHDYNVFPYDEVYGWYKHIIPDEKDDEKNDKKDDEEDDEEYDEETSARDIINAIKNEENITIENEKKIERAIQYFNQFFLNIEESKESEESEESIPPIPRNFNQVKFWYYEHINKPERDIINAIKSEEDITIENEKKIEKAIDYFDQWFAEFHKQHLPKSFNQVKFWYNKHINKKEIEELFQKDDPEILKILNEEKSINGQIKDQSNLVNNTEENKNKTYVHTKLSYQIPYYQSIEVPIPIIPSHEINENPEIQNIGVLVFGILIIGAAVKIIKTFRKFLQNANPNENIKNNLF